MKDFSKEELEKAISLLVSTITKCQNMQLKFSEGTSQHSLLRNRIKALCISKALLEGDISVDYTNQELREAIPPIVSIINKTTKAQSKYEKGTLQFKRFEPMIQTMLISKDFIDSKVSFEKNV